MIGFPRLRNKYKGNINKLAFLGMAGDTVVAVSLYLAYKYYKTRQLAGLEEKKEKALKESLQFYPPKIEKIEYNRFSPYTPIPYHNDQFTKFQHHHIDLVGYLNEKQNNAVNYYYARYNDYTASDQEVERNMDWHNPYELLGDVTKAVYKHHGHQGHHA